ncbi:LacI family DNA-binding transcriptional regulator [Streptomyces sp. NPDC060194]|uniref:LacI family DNA-binding transcriptional regulator n=1 Tax=Streptomyces sp. NPDC060194 TaxID=3347069 RepID=UPI00365FEF16
MKRPTVADIARRAGVSKVAVSYALNGRPGVSESTRSRILAIAEEIGWRPNSAARALRGARAGAVGLVLSRPARVLGVEPFFMELISGIESTLSEHSCALTLQVVGDHQREIEIYRRWWGESRIDGAFLVDLHRADPRVAAVEALEMPAVVIGNPVAAGSLPAVWSDDEAAIRETVAYLTALGHRNLARIAGLPDLVHTTLRDDAFTRACRGLPHHSIAHTDYTGEEGARATRHLLSDANRPTAVIYDNDIMAVAGLSAAQEMGLDVPRDLSIVAWDDSPIAQVTRPALTALSRDIAAYGAHAAETLLARISGQHAQPFEDQTARLTPRGSTAVRTT